MSSFLNALSTVGKVRNTVGNAISGIRNWGSGSNTSSLGASLTNQNPTPSAPSRSSVSTFTPIQPIQRVEPISPPPPATTNRSSSGANRAAAPAPSAPAAPSIPGFNPQDYAALNPDVVQQYGTDPAALMSHYINFGMKEGRFINLQDAAIAGKTPGTQSTTFDQEQEKAKAYFEALENQKREQERLAAEERRLAEEELGLANTRLDNSIGDFKQSFNFASGDLDRSRQEFGETLYNQKNRQLTEVDQQKEDLARQYQSQAEGMDAADEKKKLEILNIFAARGTSQSSEFNKTLAEYQGNTMKLRQDFSTAFNTAMSRLDKEKQLLSNEYSTKLTAFERDSVAQKEKLVAEYNKAIRDFGLARKDLSLQQMKIKADIQKRANEIFNQIEEKKGSLILGLQQRVADQNKAAEALRLDLLQRRTQFNEQVRQYENNFAFQRQQAAESNALERARLAQASEVSPTRDQEKDALYAEATDFARNWYKSEAFNKDNSSTENVLKPDLLQRYGGALGEDTINSILYGQRRTVSNS